MSYLHHLVVYQPITPLHIGCGQDVGVVDLPVIRERTTGYPFVPGSGIRGSLRDVFRQRASESAKVLFGPTAEESEEGPRYAGCVAVQDARLLLFPVRSDRAPFVWITCQAVLARFSRDAEIFLAAPDPWRIEGDHQPPDDETLLGQFGAGQMSLEEHDYNSSAGGPTVWLAHLAQVLGLPEIAQRTAVVTNESFHYFVTHATQVLQHNRLTTAKTVAQGQLFAVEAVPPETIFYGFLGATDPRLPQEETEAPDAAEASSADAWTRGRVVKELQGILTGPGGVSYLQLGGDEGTGLGVTKLVWASTTAQENGHGS